MSLKIKAKTTDIFHKDMEERIIEDIREMDADSLIELIQHLYPVNAEFNEDGETMKITVESGAELNLEDIF